MKHELEIFVDDTIFLDDNEYVECMFKNCTFMLSCDRPIQLHNSSLDQCTFQFIGPAANVVAFFKNFSRAAGPDAVEYLIQQMLGS